MDHSPPVAASLQDAAVLDEIRRELARLRPYQIRIPIYEGPMDLLLFLVQRRELDIYDIPMAEITEEYFEYLVLMEVLDIEVAGEFLVMAATLLVIKSRMLLPIDSVDELDELEEQEAQVVDPRAELQRKLIEYQRCRDDAEYLRAQIERQALLHGREVTDADELSTASMPLESVSVFDLLSVFKQMLLRTVEEEPPVLERPRFTVADKMSAVVSAVRLCADGLSFFRTVSERPTRLEVIVTFLAILELIRRRRVIVQQRSPMAEIRIYAGPELASDGD